jgi:serine/threonine protein kinase
MIYPSRSEIVTAIRNPQISFGTDEFKNGSTFTNGSKIIQYSGGYSVVFPYLTSKGEKIALRCWIADINQAKERIRNISNFFTKNDSPYFVNVNYVEDELLVNGCFYPIVTMDWVEGLNLKEYINKHINQSSILEKLANDFLEMVKFLHSINVAHGDLQHGNILIKDNGDLILVDYDSMYVESLKGMPDTIKGLAGYQHPNRVNNKEITPNLDYFSELIIYLSILIYIDKPHLWNKYYQSEDLLFSLKDFLDYSKSDLIKEINKSSNPVIHQLFVELEKALKIDDINNLKPLEILIKDNKQDVIDNIFNKWCSQPNPPEIKKTILPDSKNIFDKM